MSGIDLQWLRDCGGGVCGGGGCGSCCSGGGGAKGHTHLHTNSIFLSLPYPQKHWQNSVNGRLCEDCPLTTDYLRWRRSRSACLTTAQGGCEYFLEWFSPDALVNGCVENDALVFIRVAMVYYRAAKVMLADYDYLLQHELFILQE